MPDAAEPVDTFEPLPAEECARHQGISLEAVNLARDCDLIDLHIDTMIPPRLWGYDPLKRHKRALLWGRFFGHLDLPRMGDGGLDGAMWSITTNPLRTAKKRWTVFQKNLERLRGVVERAEGRLRFARNVEEFRAAKADGAHAIFLSIQGGNALTAAPEAVASVPDQLLVRVTLVHLTSSGYGATSAPFSVLGRNRGLTGAGRDLIAQLNHHRIFVDLAHIHPRAFWDAIEVHDATQPLIVTHTGVDGVRRHWRNLDDDQAKAIAGTGGTIGVVFHQDFLRPRLGDPRRAGLRDGQMIVAHMGHLIELVGEDHISIGSDLDGLITPPPDLRAGLYYPKLVHHMLERGWSERRIRKVLGGNFLRVLKALRG